MSPPPTDIADAGRTVLQIEAEALARMAADLPGDFSTVVEQILQLSGRVIVSGIGKSGHIARKISAIRAFFGWLAESGRIQANAAAEFAGSRAVGGDFHFLGSDRA